MSEDEPWVDLTLAESIPPEDGGTPIQSKENKVADQTGVVGTLTDGTGVSPINATKFIKDFVADVLMSGAAALIGAQILDVGSAIQGPQTTAFALVGAVIRAGYRAALRWATTD